MKTNIERELELWMTAFLLSMATIISLGAVGVSFWYVWKSFEDKSIAVFAILIIVAFTVVVRNFLNGGKHAR